MNGRASCAPCHRPSKRLDSHTVSVFAGPDTFTQKWHELAGKTAAFAKARNLTARQKLDAVVEIFIEANRVHPFPEGNGRSLQVFMLELARRQGVALDYTKISASEWNRASAVSPDISPWPCFCQPVSEGEVIVNGEIRFVPGKNTRTPSASRQRAPGRTSCLAGAFSTCCVIPRAHASRCRARWAPPR